MKFALLLAFTVAVAASAQDQVVPAKVACGYETPHHGFEILGGKEAKAGKHRYVAGLKKSSDGETVCGGSLIAPNVVLTAAHCFNEGLTSVVVGTHYLTGFADGELATVTQQIEDPNGTGVGIVILDRNITSIQPVKLLFEFIDSFTLTWVRGWGYVKSCVPKSSELNKVSVKVWNKFKRWTWLRDTVPDNIMVAGGGEGDHGCLLDLGAPLISEENAFPLLVGVLRGGLCCRQRNSPGVYERIAAARAFIEPYLLKYNVLYYD
ncbi:hypothetical protein DYB34_005272 [Aphanomyces astaci]|uniref:Peptidase S1 domain-containing protein n=1 Tax=Aphanomyces astaci TaxID=112090 RepID=A0A3R7DHS3_APHAT|nr:hypothetical protein DYB34_005272 [Aphanomyces astaci]